MPRRWPTAESPTVTPAAGRTCCRRNFPAAARRTTAPRQWCPNMPTAPRRRRLYSTVQKLMSANPSCPACPCSVTAMASKPFPFSSRTQAAFPLRYATPYTKPRTSSPARWSTPTRARSRSRCTKPLPFPSTLRRTRWSLLPSTAHGRQSVPRSVHLCGAASRASAACGASRAMSITRPWPCAMPTPPRPPAKPGALPSSTAATTSLR